MMNCHFDSQLSHLFRPEIEHPQLAFLEAVREVLHAASWYAFGVPEAS